MGDKNVYWALVAFVVLFGGIYLVFGLKYISGAQKLAAVNNDIYNKLEGALKEPASFKNNIKPSKDVVEFVSVVNEKKSQDSTYGDKKPNLIIIESSNEIELPSPKEVLKRLDFNIEERVSLTGGVEGLKISDPIKVAYEKMLDVVSRIFTGNVRVLSDEEMAKYNMPGYKVVFLNIDSYKGDYVFMLVDSRRGLWFLIIKPEVYGESLKQWLKGYFNS